MCAEDTGKPGLEVEPASSQIDRDKIEQGIRMFLEGIGEDPDREGLRDTPTRIANMWLEFATRRKYTCSIFEAEDYNEMVMLSLPLYSICEHHLLPFYGTIHVAYIPAENKVLGLSKICRIIDHFALRPTIQERLTIEIAGGINSEVSATGVGVVIEAEHMCMSMRGVQKPGHVTKTSRLLGSFLESPQARAEFLALIGR